ncbi:MAG: S1 family peptidase [Desulfuromonadaceae bacterium]|nr:S1 family peptidase [Desulfuromonadaceae bacterium]
MRNPVTRYATYSLSLIMFLLTLLFSAGGAVALGPEDVDLPEQAAVVFDQNHPAVKAVMAVQNRHTERLLGEPGVVGTATGLAANGRPAVLVLVESFHRARAARIPAELDGQPVAVKITGKITALKKGGIPATPGEDDTSTVCDVDPAALFDRAVPLGVSTGHPAITAGTIGARVTDGINVYALSNNHVYANENLASYDDEILQPGAYDGGATGPNTTLIDGDEIGTLYDFEEIVFSTSANNTIDAAIAWSSPDVLGNATPCDGYGAPKSTTLEPRVNLKVRKYGRTTGLTSGLITAINATVSVGYDSGTARFVNQIIIEPGGFSAGGDSGSLVVAVGKGRTKTDERKPVGLLFAGNTTITVANPIDAVLDRFGVTIDGE